MIPDTYYVAPIFLSALPMFNEASAEKSIGRYRTMALSEAMVLSPLYADWQGTDKPRLNADIALWPDPITGLV